MANRENSSAHLQANLVNRKELIAGSPRRERIKTGMVVLVLGPSHTPEMPILGLCCLAGYLRKKGIPVTLFDLNIKLYNTCDEEDKNLWKPHNQDFWTERNKIENLFGKYSKFINETIEQILKINPGIVGFSNYFTNVIANLFLAKRIKELIPEVKIIFGGPEIKRIISNRALYDTASNEDLSLIDLFVSGEGERILYEYVLEPEKVEDIAKYLTVGRDFYLSSEELPEPDFSSLSLSDYTNRGWLSYYFSRGCINRCIFCDERLYWQGYRTRNAQQVFSGIREIKKRYPSIFHFYFCESLINGNMNVLKEFAQLMADNELNVSWEGNVVIRPEMTKELLILMKRGGCYSLNYGVESVSPEVLSFVGKNMSKNADIEKIIRFTWESGIRTVLNFMFGLPSETDENAKMNIDFVLRNKEYISAVIPSFAFCNITEYTEAYQSFKKYGIKRPVHAHFWESVDGTNTFPVRLERFERFIRAMHENGVVTGIPFDKYKFLTKDYLEAYYSFRSNRAVIATWKDSVRSIFTNIWVKKICHRVVTKELIEFAPPFFRPIYLLNPGYLYRRSKTLRSFSDLKIRIFNIFILIRKILTEKYKYPLK